MAFSGCRHFCAENPAGQNAQFAHILREFPKNIRWPAARKTPVHERIFGKDIWALSGVLPGPVQRSVLYARTRPALGSVELEYREMGDTAVEVRTYTVRLLRGFGGQMRDASTAG